MGTFQVFVLAVILVPFGSTLMVEESGVLPIHRGDILILFYLTVLNDCEELVDVEARGENCCDTLNPEDPTACEFMKLMGGHMGQFKAREKRNITLFYITPIPHGRRGHCEVELWFSRPGGDTQALNHRVPFDTVIHHGVVPPALQGYYDPSAAESCRSNDLDALAACAPVDCRMKYGGVRPFFSRAASRCVAAPACAAPAQAYDPAANACRDLGAPLSAEDERLLRQPGGPPRPAHSGDAQGDLPGTYAPLVRCHHGQPDPKTGLCRCDEGWSFAAIDDPEALPPSTFMVHLCTQRLPCVGWLAAFWFPILLGALTGLAAALLSVLVYLCWRRLSPKRKVVMEAPICVCSLRKHRSSHDDYSSGGDDRISPLLPRRKRNEHSSTDSPEDSKLRSSRERNGKRDSIVLTATIPREEYMEKYFSAKESNGNKYLRKVSTHEVSFLCKSEFGELEREWSKMTVDGQMKLGERKVEDSKRIPHSKKSMEGIKGSEPASKVESLFSSVRDEPKVEPIALLSGKGDHSSPPKFTSSRLALDELTKEHNYEKNQICPMKDMAFESWTGVAVGAVHSKETNAKQQERHEESQQSQVRLADVGQVGDLGPGAGERAPGKAACRDPAGAPPAPPRRVIVLGPDGPQGPMDLSPPGGPSGKTSWQVAMMWRGQRKRSCPTANECQQDCYSAHPVDVAYDSDDAPEDSGRNREAARNQGAAPGAASLGAGSASPQPSQEERAGSAPETPETEQYLVGVMTDGDAEQAAPSCGRPCCHGVAFVAAASGSADRHCLAGHASTCPLSHPDCPGASNKMVYLTVRPQGDPACAVPELSTTISPPPYGSGRGSVTLQLRKTSAPEPAPFATADQDEPSPPPKEEPTTCRKEDNTPSRTCEPECPLWVSRDDDEFWEQFMPRWRELRSDTDDSR